MPSTKSSKTTYDTGPWKAIQPSITDTALPALKSGLDYATTGAGGQLLNQATTFAGDTMAGKYLDLANNPYLSNAMDAASRSTQTYYDALAARSGRGPGGGDFAGEMARGTESARLAPLLQLYESERNRQMGAMGATPGLQMAGMTPSLAYTDALRGLGALGKSGTESTESKEFNPMGIAGAVLGAMTGNPMMMMGSMGGGMTSAFQPGGSMTSVMGPPYAGSPVTPMSTWKLPWS